MNFIHAFTSDGLMVAVPVKYAVRILPFLKKDGEHASHLLLQIPGAYVVGR